MSEKTPQDQQQYNFPPPPPGPPPAGTAHELGGNQISPSPQEHHSAQQSGYHPASYPPPPNDPHQQQQQHIPEYNPSAPAFAPPPTGEATAAGGFSQSHGHAHDFLHHNDVAPSANAGAQPDAQHHKSSWGERLAHLGSKAAAPINALSHKLGSQSFLPETMDKECDKAALILKTFCKKGVYADPSTAPTSTDPNATESTSGMIDPTKEKPKNRVLVTIPPRVISKAVGLAIFTTLRAGFQVSGATGSGILIARLPDGSWGPPSGIQVHSVGGGFQIGLDIYDCVCVINSKEALAAFTNTRVSLGSDLAVVAGPYGAGGAVEFGAAMDQEKKQPTPDANKPPVSPSDPSHGDQTLKPDTGGDSKASHRRSLSASRLRPVFSYVKSRGFYAGVQVDGTVVVERKEANAAFYGAQVPVNQILKGDVPPQGPSGMWPIGAQVLRDVLRGAEAGALKDGMGDSATHGGGASSTPVYAAGGSAAPTVGSESAPPTNPGTSELHPPGYVDDGVSRPDVGDHKYA